MRHIVTRTRIAIHSGYDESGYKTYDKGPIQVSCSCTRNKETEAFHSGSKEYADYMALHATDQKVTVTMHDSPEAYRAYVAGLDKS